jgi:hypothetical protein
MAWVAFDRAIKAIVLYGLPGPVDEWRATRARIHAEICEHGFDKERNTFRSAYGETTLDASLLLMAQVGFIKPKDPRYLGTQVMTIKTVEGVSSDTGTKFTFTAAFATQPPSGTAYSLVSALASGAAARAADPPQSLQEALSRLSTRWAGKHLHRGRHDTSTSTPAVSSRLTGRTAHTQATLTLNYPRLHLLLTIQQTLIGSAGFPVPVVVTESRRSALTCPLPTATGRPTPRR